MAIQQSPKSENTKQNLALGPDHSQEVPRVPRTAKSTLATEKPALGGAQVVGIAHVFWMSPYNVGPSR